MKSTILTAIAVLFITSSALAWDRGDHIEHYYDKKGDRIAHYYDVKGNQIDAHYDRLALKAALNGNIGRAIALDAKGDRINAQLDAKAERIDSKLDRKGRRIARAAYYH